MSEFLQLTSENPFHLEPEKPGFESMGKDNGFRYWYATELAKLLEYDSHGAFLGAAINKAMQTCVALGISINDNFKEEDRVIDGKKVRDYRLSRFACYLAAMNGDPRKRMVALAQTYFVKLAEACQLYLEQTEGIERVQIRAEISDREKSLAGVAKTHGVVEYPFFQNAGYRGLYNMNLSRLRELKNVPQGRSPLDFMGKEEMAANLFRITQTEAKIKNENIKGQQPLEAAAETVGKKVRQTMVATSGNRPEDLAPHEDIKTVQKHIKSAHRQLKKIGPPAGSKPSDE